MRSLGVQIPGFSSCYCCLGGSQWFGSAVSCAFRLLLFFFSPRRPETDEELLDGNNGLLRALIL